MNSDLQKYRIPVFRSDYPDNTFFDELDHEDQLDWILEQIKKITSWYYEGWPTDMESSGAREAIDSLDSLIVWLDRAESSE